METWGNNSIPRDNFYLNYNIRCWNNFNLADLQIVNGFAHIAMGERENVPGCENVS